MAVTQYIGSRYVPLLADPADWSSENTYEPLTIVLHEGNSYTSKQAVPKGISIDNEAFWAQTGNYNAQVELYRREVMQYKDEITEMLQEGFEGVYRNVYSIYQFEGDTPVDKLETALNTVESGVIYCGPIDIDKTIKLSSKDYRMIQLHGGTFNITTTMFDHTDTVSGYVPSFNDCVFQSTNDSYLFVGNRTLVNPIFDGCYMSGIGVYHSDTNYIQSPYFIGCTIDDVVELFTATRCYDMKIIGTLIAHCNDTIINVTTGVGLQNCSITASLIEVMRGCVIVTRGLNSFSMTNCYVENVFDGLLQQTDRTASCSGIVSGNSFVGTLHEDITYLMQFAIEYTRSFLFKIVNNQWRITTAETKLSNLPLLPMSLVNTNVKPYTGTNNMYQTGAEYEPLPNGTKLILHDSFHDAVWSADDNAYVIDWYLPYSSNQYLTLHPFVLMVSGPYTTASTNRRGYGVFLCCPYTGHDGTSYVHGMKITKIDAMNTNSATDDTVTCVGEFDDTNPDAWCYHLKVTGFISTSNVKLRYKVIDSWFNVDGCLEV